MPFVSLEFHTERTIGQFNLSKVKVYKNKQLQQQQQQTE